MDMQKYEKAKLRLKFGGGSWSGTPSVTRRIGKNWGSWVGEES